MVIFCYRRAAGEMRNSEIITEAAGRGYNFKISDKRAGNEYLYAMKQVLMWLISGPKNNQTLT